MKKKKKAQVQSAWSKLAQFGKAMLESQSDDTKEFIGIAVGSLTEEDLRELSGYFAGLADEKAKEKKL